MQTKPRIELDASQQAAAHRALSESTNVVAGAGTGKTSVLVARYLKLVEDDGIPLDRLLALTFTLKAAAEMRDRIRAEVSRRLPGQARLLAGAWILNFHQFGYRFIKENAPALGVDPGVDVLSPAEYERVMGWMRARFEAGRIDGIAPDFGGDPPIPTELPALFEQLMKIVHKCRGNMISPQYLRRMCTPEDHAPYLARVDAVVALAAAWETELRRRNLLDFSDMIAIPARALVEHPELAARYRSAFDHILVDEFQDTSRAQNEMLRALSDDDFSRVTVVGDVKQAIYRWRDARTENITEFPAEKKELRINYRSRQNILDLAQQLVDNRPELEGFATRLKADRGAGVHPALMFHPPGEDTSYELEAAGVADWVEHLMGRHPAPAAWELAPLERALAPSEIAVLLRNFRGSRSRYAIEREFLRRGIPYALIGGAASAEAVALEAWHELLSLLLPGPRAVNLLAVLETRPFAISEASLHQFLRDAKDAGTTVLLSEERIERITDARDAGTVRSLRDVLAELARALERLGFREFLAWAVERTPLRLELGLAGVTPAATDDLLREIFELGDTLARHGAVSLAAFLDHLNATLDEGRFREEGDVRLPDDRIAMMTIHQAKGLEFPAVAVVGAGPMRRNNDEHFIISPTKGLFFSKTTGARWERERKRAPENDHEKLQEELEERCILYVGLTRARDYLWISSPFADGIGRGRSTQESLFTDLLTAARAKSLVRELRSAGEEKEDAMPREKHTVPDAEAEVALRAWAELRGAAEAREMSEPVTTRALETATWASLARYQACPLSFWFDRTRERVVRDDEESDEPIPQTGDFPAVRLPKGVDPAAFGVFVHGVLEQRTDSDAALERALQSLAARHNFGKHAATVMDLARTCVAAACSAGVADTSTTAQSELPFSVRGDRLLVHGVIDRLDSRPDATTITDYKLGVHDPAHAFQVSVYAWAAQRIAPRAKVSARVAYIGHDPVRVDDVTPDLGRIEQLVVAMERSLVSGEFQATPGAVCAACAHRTVCEFAV